jgi:hypothetical protein
MVRYIHKIPSVEILKIRPVPEHAKYIVVNPDPDPQHFARAR